jgi:hypothetical protein
MFFRIASPFSVAICCLVSSRLVNVTEEAALDLLDWAHVLLTSAKGAAGWYMNSAALLADAGHSLSGKHAFQPAALL